MIWLSLGQVVNPQPGVPGQRQGEMEVSYLCSRDGVSPLPSAGDREWGQSPGLTHPVHLGVWYLMGRAWAGDRQRRTTDMDSVLGAHSAHILSSQSPWGEHKQRWRQTLLTALPHQTFPLPLCLRR